MTGRAALQAAVTVLAVAVAVLHLPDLGPARGARTRLHAGLHLAMAAGMAAMAWPVGMEVPAALGAGVFSAGAGAYAYQIAVPSRLRPPAGLESGHHTGLLLWYHLAMMASMAWMYVAMPEVRTGLPPWAALLCWACMLLFAAALLLLVRALLRTPAGRVVTRGTRRRLAASACMAAAMLAGFGTLVTAAGLHAGPH